MTAAEQLLNAGGWRRTPSGRWVHPALPAAGAHGRRRPFTEAEALTLLGAALEHGQAQVEPVEPTTPMPEVPTA